LLKLAWHKVCKTIPINEQEISHCGTRMPVCGMAGNPATMADQSGADPATTTVEFATHGNCL